MKQFIKQDINTKFLGILNLFWNCKDIVAYLAIDCLFVCKSVSRQYCGCQIISLQIRGKYGEYVDNVLFWMKMKQLKLDEEFLGLKQRQSCSRFDVVGVTGQKCSRVWWPSLHMFCKGKMSIYLQNASFVTNWHQFETAPREFRTF